ncbi:substrate-binding domain-containing protein [Methylocapsa polymorpha]|uniref:Substrate-binding domain-containing protein n=1 Tax=Methylocapsa polymorpha TaxID=3080828 RepID=A0ABZ0HWS3_9HYPH|nr:substrate-binding domain-containing protein [Methylocapsa sp. RX1]
MKRLLFILALFLASPAFADEFITLASTTSTEQSGLFSYLIPLFKQASGIDVHVVAVGTGQALAIGARGDADALLVHDREGEDNFVADGHGIDRRDVMFNDFVLIGPKSDPADVRGVKNAKEALRKIAEAKAPFASRGDDSGTHRMELRLWKAAGVDVAAAAAPWRRETGSGMGPTLNIAASLDAYVLADRATWANFKNRQSLEILSEGDPVLFNPYGSILVNPKLHPHVKAEPARRWHEWLTSAPGRAAIASYKINGEQVFFLPDAMVR